VNCGTFDALPRQYTSNSNIALPILQYGVAGKHGSCKVEECSQQVRDLRVGPWETPGHGPGSIRGHTLFDLSSDFARALGWKALVRVPDVLGTDRWRLNEPGLGLCFCLIGCIFHLEVV
jgi:hypothetical protein